jgi:hypothetical protein
MSQLKTITLNQKELVIDEEFRNLIPKLTSEEYEQLETSIKEDKCRDSIITWNGTIIDGHNRYDICKKNNIDFDTVSKDFKDRDEVKLWIIDNQFGRRNLTKYDRSVLALKKKAIISANAKKNQGTRTDISQKSVKSIDTQKKLAKNAGVSHDTIYKVEVIERSATEEQKDKIRKQTSTINKVFKDIARQQKRKKFRRENAKLAEQYVEDDAIRIIHGDFYEVCKDFEKDSVDLLLTDPPYPIEYIHVWEQLGEIAARVLKPSCFLVAYSGHMYLDRVMHDLGKHLDFYWPLSLLHSGPTQLVNPRNVIAGFKPILLYQKPPFKKLEGSPLRDVITKDNRDKNFHEWGQGELAVEMLMNHFSKPNSLVLEPFLGGGTTLLVAKKLKRRAIGIDIDIECIKTTQSRLVKNHCENKTKSKPIITEGSVLTEDHLGKPKIGEDRVNHGDESYSINQFEGIITEILTEKSKTPKDIVSARFPVKSNLSKEEIEIVWVNDDEEPDHSGPDASPQLLKADDYENGNDLREVA